ncbi:MAG: riboflavin biosynthesis protein RibF [Bacteroidales bacterium]|nr:riboflavin biosynthesis protein RibF [Bacteroidales bacterium]
MFSLYDIHGPIATIPEPTAVTVGVFDGVHRGHRELLKDVSLVVTLTAHPSFVLGRRDSEYWLDDPEEHLRLLFEAGAKYVAVLPFTREVANLSACQMARLLYDKLQMRSLLLGYDSRFGSKSNDDFDHLPQLASELGFTLKRGNPFLVDGEPISSSRIRESLTGGFVEETSTLLGRPYAVTGTVLHGRGVGHTLGFPTANIDLTKTRKMLPKEGVYAVRIKNEALSIKNCGMANLGAAPTFGVEKPLLEVHLLDFEGDLYGQTVTVEFIHRLRDIVRFDSAEALQHQLQIDLKNCRQL